MFKKIASVIASAVMIGSTMGAALAATNYPAPFVSGGSADAAIVYGSNAAVSDLSAAIDIQTNLNSKVTSSSGTTAMSSGGDSISLASSSQKMYMNSSLDKARTVITKDHLPTLLADGSATDNSGTEYKYTQTITPGSNARKVAFSKSGESVDPGLILDLGYSGSSNPTYNYTLTFSKPLDVTRSDVIGTAQVSILGNKYVVGANSDQNTLYLYGSGTTTTVEEGQTTTVKVGSMDHTIMLVGTSSTTSATIEVDGSSRSITKGNSYKFANGFEIYFKDLYHATKTGTLSRVELLVGSQTLHLENASTVRVGSDDTTLLGTYAMIQGSGAGNISQIVVSQSAESSIGDYLKAGQSYTDRIFGNLVLDNVGPVPALDATARDTITIDTDNSVSARATFTSALSGDGKPFTLVYARDSDNAADSSLARTDLAYDTNLNMSNMEGANVKVNERTVVNDNDEGRILQVISIGAGSSTNDYARLRDVITGVDYDFSTGLNNATTAARSIGGASYNLASNPSNADSSLWTVNLTWGAGSTAGDVGTQTTLFPRVKLKSGEWISFLTNTTVTGGVTYSLPGLYLLSDYKSGATLTYHNHSNEGANPMIANQTTFGNVIYNVTWAINQSKGSLNAVRVGSTGSYCIFNSTMGPAVLIQEEKTLDSSNGNAICIPLATQGSNPIMPAIGTPIFGDTVGSFVSLQSNTYKAQAVDLYGTMVERDTSTGTNYAVTLKYPDEQMYIDVFFRAKSTSVTPGSSGSTGTGTVLILKDTEVTSDFGKNLVVIGGSCVNTVARKIVDPTATSPICGADFTAKTNVGAGQYLLKAVQSPYNTGKVAMLVAGYEAANTASAAAKLKEGHDTTVGTSKIYPVTSA